MRYAARRYPQRRLLLALACLACGGDVDDPTEPETVGPTLDMSGAWLVSDNGTTSPCHFDPISVELQFVEVDNGLARFRGSHSEGQLACTRFVDPTTGLLTPKDTIVQLPAGTASGVTWRIDPPWGSASYSHLVIGGFTFIGRTPSESGLFRSMSGAFHLPPNSTEPFDPPLSDPLGRWAGVRQPNP